MQYMDTGWVGVVVTLLLVGFILGSIYRAQAQKKRLFIRRIAGLNAIDDAIGRATEMGRPVLMVPGIGGTQQDTAVSVQAVNIFGSVAKTAAQFSTPIRLCCANAAVYAVAQELIRDVYRQQGMIDRFQVDYVQFVSDQQFAFAAGVSGMIVRDKVAATFLLGPFYAESLIFAETANSVGAIQVAGSTTSTQTPFFVAACDYVLIGDEFYAASAYLTREPVLTGSLVGQDFCKMAVAGMLMLGTLGASIERTQPASERREDLQGAARMVPNAEFVKEDGTPRVTTPLKRREDTFVHNLFNPMVDPKKLEEATGSREKIPTDAAEGEGGGS